MANTPSGRLSNRLEAMKSKILLSPAFAKKKIHFPSGGT